MNSTFSFLTDLGEEAWMWFWLPVALWSVIATAVLAVTRLASRQALARPVIQQLVFALPIGIALNAAAAGLKKTTVAGLITLPEFVAPSVSATTTPTTIQFIESFWFISGCTVILVAAVATHKFGELLLRTYTTRQAVRLFRTSVDEATSQRGRSLSTQLGSRAPVDVCYSHLASVPFAAGWRRPVIVLPDSFRGDTGLDLALIHELSHIRRRHAFSRWTLFATRAAFWFHPLVSSAVEQIITLQECECDSDVVTLSAAGRRTYATLLYNFSAGTVDQLAPATHSQLLCTSIYSKPNQLKQRIVAMQSPLRISTKSNRILSALTLVAVVGLMACAEVASPTSTAELDIAEATATIGGDALSAESVTTIPTLKSGFDDLVYPAIAKKAGVEGKVIVKFVVDKDGSVASASVVRGIGAGCDEEALRFVKQSTWTPGVADGKAVAVELSLPITFKLPESDS